MGKYLSTVLFLLFFAACNNDSGKKIIETDSTVVVKDSSGQVSVITPVNLDSITSTKPVTASIEAVSIKFNPPLGTGYQFNTSIDMNQAMPGQQMKSSMSNNYILKVTKEDKTGKEITVTYGDLSMQMEMNGKKMSFGPGQKEEANNPLNMIGRMFSVMKGKSFMMKVNEAGEITEVEGFDKIADAVITEMNIPESGRETFNKSFKSQFNENTVKQVFAESFNVFPSKKVKPGDSWQKKASLPMANRSLDVFTTYTLKELRGNNYIVDARTKYENPGSKPVIGTSRLLVDAKTGMVVEMDSEQKMEGSGTVISRSRVRSKKL